MFKNWKLVLGFGIGLWILIFVAISILLVIPMPEIVFTILGLFVAPIVALVLAMLYFKKNPGDIKEGIVLAVLWIIVGTILDLLVTIQYVKGDGSYMDGLNNFYGAWSLWVSFLLTIIVVAVVAKTTRGGELMKKPPISSPPIEPPAPPIA